MREGLGEVETTPKSPSPKARAFDPPEGRVKNFLTS
jgi:hypothetical protein